jgi:S-adenosylmethionine:tRNA ribosyltransferase-isomerase
VKTWQFDYQLPPERIAQVPAEPRDSSRLLVLHRTDGQLEHRRFTDLSSYLRPGDLLVLNNTRVIPARLVGRKTTGGQVELLLLEPQPEHTWRALVRGHRVREGTEVHLLDAAQEPCGVSARITAVEEGGTRLVHFDRPIGDWLTDVGQVPLPPYIHHYAGDPERYQTVFAQRAGSSAAPTAGLHFTPDLLLSLHSGGVQISYLTLHIGLDTFKPIEENDIGDHRIHTEWAELSAETANQINQTRLAGGRIIAVGTTVVRTLEAAYHRGQPQHGACGWRTVSAFSGRTDLYITPGFAFGVVDALITNFHLPRSTLIVLVAAFAGIDTIRQAYAEAILHDYRFYSFGDAMLIL